MARGNLTQTKGGSRLYETREITKYFNYYLRINIKKVKLITVELGITVSFRAIGVMPI